MKSFRNYGFVAMFASGLVLVGAPTADAQFVYATPSVVAVQPALRPVSPRRWWRMQRRAYRNTAVVPVTGVAVASPVATTVGRVAYSPITAYRPIASPVTAFSPVVTAYSPVVTTAASPCCPAPVCCPTTTCRKVCEPRTTCRYVPQTCYRTQHVNVPVTTMRPAVSVDACTGCAVTTMRPVTTMVTHAQRVPYTTYRMVCSTVNIERTVCSQTMSCSSCVQPASFAAPVAAVAAPAPCPTGNCATGGAGHIGTPTPTPQLTPAPAEVNRPATPPIPMPQSIDGGNGYESTTPTSVKPLREIDNVLPSVLPPLPNAGDKSAQLNSKPSLSLVALPSATPESRPVRKLDVSGWE